ncbi:MAG: ATP-binding cassette domain-containing protein [Bacteriovoracaceae bacterium]|nr:ATP-binding cassette domain-containing protein [Bacteriovoracaceae bacterium]
MKEKIKIQNLTASYNGKSILRNINLSVIQNEILAVIGPANSGKTSLLRCINRMCDFIPEMDVEGDILLDGVSTFAKRDSTVIRRRIGMVSPLPVGLPMSIRDNVTFAPKVAGCKDPVILEEIMEDCLKKSALWDEVKDRLDMIATKLSGGQQQRLTIARALSHFPEVLCLDEFSIAIDPVTTMRIEEILKELKKEMTIILVTNLNFQARRLSDRTAMIFEGDLLEVGATKDVFSGNTQQQKTKDYIEGLFG